MIAFCKKFFRVTIDAVVAISRWSEVNIRAYSILDRWNKGGASNNFVMSHIKTVFIVAVIFTQIQRSQADVTIRNDGVVLVNNQTFFPYGFYTDEKIDMQAMLNHVRITGQAGFNVMHLEPLDNGAIPEIFAEAEANSQYLIYGASKGIRLPALHDVYARIKNQPALLGHNIGDDVHDGTMVGYPTNVADVKKLYDDLRVYEQRHICMVALGGSGGQTDVFAAKRFDASAEEIYPINGGSEIKLVYSSSLGIVSNSLRWNQSPWVALQTFNWNENPEQRMPRFDEYYNMLYQSIVAGVKGIMLYTHHETTNGVDTDINLWNGIKTTVPEIKKIKPFLTDGKFKKTELGVGLYAATWEYQNQVLAIVVHAGNYRSYFDPSQNPADTRQVSLTLPTGILGPSQPAFTNRPTGMTISNGKLMGTINLLEVHAYIIDRQEAILTGTIIGSPPYASSSTYAAARAFGNEITTFFTPVAVDSFAQSDLGTNQEGRITKIRFYPRLGYPERMNGSKFQGSNDAVNWIDLHTIVGNPLVQWNEVLVRNPAYFRYLRYRQPTYLGDVSEIEFRGVTRAVSNGLQTFRASLGLPANGSEDLLTPASDEVKNLLKYAFNMIGTGEGQKSALSLPNRSILGETGIAGLPRVGRDGTGKQTFSYVRRKASSNSGISYAEEFSTTGVSWSSNAQASEMVTSIDATFERVIVTYSLNAESKRFIRVKVTSL